MGLGAFTGRIGYVDLSTGATSIEPLDEAMARDYLGSTGINMRLLADLGGVGGTAWDEDNPIIVGAGTMVGTLLPGASRTSITTRSPITGGYGHSNSGSFGDKLKAAGFDHLVITGIAERPVIVVCDDGALRVEDAGEAWGKDTYDATDVIQARYPGSSIAAIGPAGENQAVAATVLTDKHGAFGSSGLGCAMGVKRLKAIVARGEHAVTVANRPALTRQCLRLFRDLMAQPHVHDWRQWGTLVQFTDINPQGQAEASDKYGFDIESWLDIYKTRLWEGPASCPGCPVGCKAKIRNGDHTIQISCPTGTLSLHFGIIPGTSTDRYKEIVGNAELANRLGVSTIWSGQLVGWLVELVKQGIVTVDEIGYEPLPGDPPTADRVMSDIAYRRGAIGDALADPIGLGQVKIGRGAERFPVRKGMLLHGYGERSGPAELGRWNGYTFGRVVDPRGPVAETAYSSIAWTPGRSERQLRDYCTRIGVPADRTEHVLTGGTDGYDLARFTPYIERYNMAIYSIGECNRPYFSRILDVDTMAELLSHATGLDHTAESVLEAGDRIVTLMRLFNGAHGLHRAADIGPEPEIDAGSAAELTGMLDSYYDEHGWDANGTPTAATLERLGLTSPVDQRLAEAAGVGQAAGANSPAPAAG